MVCGSHGSRDLTHTIDRGYLRQPRRDPSVAHVSCPNRLNEEAELEQVGLRLFKRVVPLSLTSLNNIC